MFRNQYDNDVTVWSPQGRIHQIEYAMEAVKQGSATVGLKSKEYAVIVALKRAPSELSAHQKKIIPIDDHVGVSIAGLTADARLLSNFMRSECLNSRYAYDRPLPISRLVAAVGNKSQIPTQRYGRRPFGVGLIVAGYDEWNDGTVHPSQDSFSDIEAVSSEIVEWSNGVLCHYQNSATYIETVSSEIMRKLEYPVIFYQIWEMGPHIYQTCPSANYYDCKSMAIGARSQSARTYLEKFLDKFVDCSLEDLLKHGLRALRDTLPQEVELTTKNCSIGIVGKEKDFTIYDDEEVARYLQMIEGEERTHHVAAPTGDDDASMETQQEGGEGGEGSAEPRPAEPQVQEQGMEQ